MLVLADSFVVVCEEPLGRCGALVVAMDDEGSDVDAVNENTGRGYDEEVITVEDAIVGTLVVEDGGGSVVVLRVQALAKIHRVGRLVLTSYGSRSNIPVVNGPGIGRGVGVVTIELDE